VTDLMSTPARLRYTFVAGATAVVIGVGFTMAGLDRHAADTARARSADIPVVTEAPPTPASPPEEADPPVPTTPAATTPAPAATTTPARPRPRATTSRPPRRPKPRPTATTTRPPRPETPPSTSGSVADRVLAHINAARAAAGLPRYTLDDDLSRAAARHNARMIDGCGLSHQCSGEGGIGARFSAEGVRWSSAGENIGLATAGSGEDAIVGAANGLTDSILAERPPNDGHRRNLLTDGFERIGLSIGRDGEGTVWMTQDFVG
jgi:uncharacterized protein YkwD